VKLHGYLTAHLYFVDNKGRHGIRMKAIKNATGSHLIFLYRRPVKINVLWSLLILEDLLKV
jgi:hypothetical protein